MKLSDELIELFDTLNPDNQSYALGIIQSLRFAQDTMNKQAQSPSKGEKAVSDTNGEDEPPT